MAKRLSWQYRREIGSRPAKSREVANSPEEDEGLGPDTEKYVLKLRAAVELTGARFVLTVVPSRDDDLRGSGGEDPFERRWRRWADHHGVEFVDTGSRFQAFRAESAEATFFRDDIHFNECGHRLFAEALLEHRSSLGGE